MKYCFSLAFALFTCCLFAQENAVYQTPPGEILELVDVPQAPSVLLDESKQHMILLYRDSYKSIEELSKEELRLGGLRIDPKTNIGSRVTYFNNVQIKRLGKKDKQVVQVKGLPENPKLTNFNWSPDQEKIALTNTTMDGHHKQVVHSVILGHDDQKSLVNPENPENP